MSSESSGPEMNGVSPVLELPTVVNVPAASTQPKRMRSVIMHLTRRWIFLSVCKGCHGTLINDAAKVELYCCQQHYWHACCFELTMGKGSSQRLKRLLPCCRAYVSKQLATDALLRYRERERGHLEDRLLDVTYREAVKSSSKHTLLQTMVIEDIRSATLSNNEAAQQRRREAWQRDVWHQKQPTGQQLGPPIVSGLKGLLVKQESDGRFDEEEPQESREPQEEPQEAREPQEVQNLQDCKEHKNHLCKRLEGSQELCRLKND